MKVKDVMHTNPISLSPTTSIYDVWKIIYKKHLMAVPIVDGRGKLVGIISFSDILKKIYPNYDMYNWDPATRDLENIERDSQELSRLKAEEIMSRRMYTVKDDNTMLAALSKMIVKQISQLPVVNEKGKLIGTIYKVDIFDTIFKKYLTK